MDYFLIFVMNVVLKCFFCGEKLLFFVFFVLSLYANNVLSSWNFRFSSEGKISFMNVINDIVSKFQSFSQCFIKKGSEGLLNDF